MYQWGPILAHNWKVILMLEDTYGAKIRPLLQVSLNNFVIKPSFKNLRDNFLTKWPRMSKVCLH